MRTRLELPEPARRARKNRRGPISWERKLEDNPTTANYYYNDAKLDNRIVYEEGIFVGYRGYQRSQVKPQFPFGYGLSYTTFEFTNLKVTPARWQADAGSFAVELGRSSEDIKATAEVRLPRTLTVAVTD